MNGRSSTLRRFNNVLLSDDVTGNIMQSSTRVDHGHMTVDDRQTSIFMWQKFVTVDQSVQDNRQGNLLHNSHDQLTVLNPNGVSEFAGHVRQDTRLPKSLRPPNSERVSYMSTPGIKRLQSTKPKRTACHQQFRESRQARYRKKMKERAISVENDVLQLREEVKKLEIQHRVFMSSMFVKTPWKVVVEYFRVFRNGLTKECAVRRDPDSATRTSYSNESYLQWGFLSSTMASAVVGGSGLGVDQMMNDWKWISLLHEDFTTQLVCLEAGPGDLMIARTKVCVMFSLDTVQYAFPHLINAENWPLARKLIGQRLCMKGSTYFQWDTESRRVVSVQYDIDMLTPMLELLGNMDDVSCVFDNAHVTSACGLVADTSLTI